jgi:hypothetical protein
MTFLNTNFLYAFLVLLIPIAVHLFNFQRYKPLLFSNLQFLMSIQSKTKQQSKLKKILLLISRLLIFSCLVLAFAQPVIKTDNQAVRNSENQVLLYVDNSLSMGAFSTEGLIMIDLAKNRAKETVQQFAHNDKFMILTNELEGSSFRFVNRDDALNIIENIQLSDYTRSLNDILKRLNDALNTKQEGVKIISIYSDFQIPNAHFEKNIINSETTVLFNLLKHENQNNLFIDSCWFEMPIIRQNQQLGLNVSIVNQSNQNFDMLPVQLIINDQEVASSVVDIKANTSQVATLNYIESSDGLKHAKVKIDDKGSFNFDDVFYFSYEIKKEINVLELYEKKSSPYLKSLFTIDSIFSFTSNSIKSIDYSSLGNYNFVILSDVSDMADGTLSELIKAQSQGVVLLFIPSLEAELSKINQVSSAMAGVQYSHIDTSRTQIEELSLEHYLFKNVFEQIPNVIDLPVVLKRFSIQTQGNILPLIRLMDGSLLLGLSNNEGRETFFMSAALDDKSGNFHRHALIVPTLMNMAIYSKKSQDLYYIVGNQQEIGMRSDRNLSDGAIRFSHKANKKEFIPSFALRSNEIKIFPHIDELEVGNYDVTNAGNILGGVSFNRKPEESQMTFYSEDDLLNKIKEDNLSSVEIINAEKNIKKSFDRILNKNSSIWSYFILLAILFLIIELLIIRVFK